MSRKPERRSVGSSRPAKPRPSPDVPGSLAAGKRCTDPLHRLGAFSLDHAGEAAFWLRRDARFIHVNDVACRMLDYTREEFLAMTVHEIDPDFPPERWEQHWREVAQRGTATFESNHRTRDGRLIPIELLVNHVEFEGAEYHVAFARDITVRRNVEREIRRREKFERLLTAISTRFINLPTGEINRGLCQALSEIAASIGVDLARLYVFDAGGSACRRVAEWSAAEGGGVPDAGAAIPLDGARAWLDRIRHGKIEVVDGTGIGNPLPDPLPPALDDAGLCSRVDVPVIVRGDPAGVLLLASASERRWSTSELALLEIAGEIVANALDRTRMESELESSQRRLRSVLDSASIVLWAIDALGRFTFSEGRGLRALDLRPGEVVGQSLFELYAAHPDVLSCVRRALDGETVRSSSTVGGVVWESHYAPVTGDDGTVRGVIGVSFDISDRHRAEEERLRLSTAIEQSAEAIVLSDRAGSIFFVNPAFERITGYARAEVIGKGARIFENEEVDDAVASGIRETLGGGGVWAGRVSHRRKDGTRIEQDATISPIHDAMGEIIGYVSVSRDVTEQVQLEALLRHSQKMEAVGQLAGGVAHDFNNILQVIRGYTELARNSVDPDSAVSDHLDAVREASERATSLVRQLLTFSRRDPLRSERLDLDRAIAGTMSLLDRLIGEHIDLRFLPSGGTKTVHADPGQIEQIVINLCVNARDAMPDGGTVRIDTETVTFGRRDLERNPWAREGSFAVLSIADHGTGIPDEQLDRIFEPFYTTKAVGQGTGLGLATVYAVVRRHEGMIRVESRVGAGTRFRIYLPLLDAAEHADAEPAAGPAARGGKETVLLAEDDTMVRRWVRGVLADAGYRVLDAGDGREALELFRRHAAEIGLALLDVVMPRLNGREVLREIRNTRPNVPVIFTSGYSYDILESHRLDEGELVVLQKPYDAEQVLARVREALDAAAGSSPKSS